jgi:hypothetical protein
MAWGMNATRGSGILEMKFWEVDVDFTNSEILNWEFGVWSWKWKISDLILGIWDTGPGVLSFEI